MQTSHNIQAIYSWINSKLHPQKLEVVELNGDASSRKYYRALINNEPFIVMDSKHDTSLEKFVDICIAMKKCNVNTSKIILQDMQERYLLLEDFGDDLYLSILNKNPNNADRLYKDAIDALINLQTNFDCTKHQFKSFSLEFIKQQLGVFQEWYLEKNLKINASAEIKQLLDDLAIWLYTFFAKQPQCFVHLDYHSRNLIHTNKNNPGILDFQDAMIGPSVYDLVSLFQDAYISWDSKKIYEWLNYYNNIVLNKDLKSKNLQNNIANALGYSDINTLIEAFYIVGLQRHLKNLGVFSRLSIRDNKQNYLQHIPLLLKYIEITLENYDQSCLKGLRDLLKKSVISNIETSVIK